MLQPTLGSGFDKALPDVCVSVQASSLSLLHAHPRECYGGLVYQGLSLLCFS